MTEPFIGQIQPYGFGFAPKNWAQCNGQILAIQQNAALFSLLGNAFGGNGTTNFALPNLQSRVPMHQGTSLGVNYVMGEEGGTENVTLSANEMPMHTHGFVGTAANASAAVPSSGVILAHVYQPSGNTPNPYYAPDTTPQPLNVAAVSPVGGNQAHTNIQPYLAVNWCIALAGIFPARN